jgi:hypothetical protein
VGGVIPPNGGRGDLHLAFSIRAEDFASWERRLDEEGIPIESRVRWDRGGHSHRASCKKCGRPLTLKLRPRGLSLSSHLEKCTLWLGKTSSTNAAVKGLFLRTSKMRTVESPKRL